MTVVARHFAIETSTKFLKGFPVILYVSAFETAKTLQNFISLMYLESALLLYKRTCVGQSQNNNKKKITVSKVYFPFSSLFFSLTRNL